MMTTYTYHISFFAGGQLKQLHEQLLELGLQVKNAEEIEMVRDYLKKETGFQQINITGLSLLSINKETVNPRPKIYSKPRRLLS